MGYEMRYWPKLLLIALSVVTQATALNADELTPEDTARQMRQGLEAVDSGQWDRAMEIFQALSDSQPDRPEATYFLGIAAAHGGNDVVAVDAFSRVAAIDPSYRWVQANLGLTLFRLGEMTRAEDHLLEALLQGPDDADVLLHLGMIDEQRGEYDRALRLFHESANEDPQVAGLAMLQAAHLELNLGNLPNALDFLERARMSAGPASAQEAADKMLAALARGSATPSRFSLNGGVGFELDDNVTLSEQDLATGLSDEALVLNAGVDIYMLRDENLWVSFGYDFYQSLYRTLTDFDAQIQEPGVSIGGRIGRVYPTFSYAYRHEMLGSEDYLSAQQIDFDLEIALAGSWSALLGVENEWRDFEPTPARSGSVTTLIVGQTIRFFDGLVSAALFWEPSWQRTDGTPFNYDGQAINAQVGFFIPRGRGIDLSLSYEYADRDYTDLTSGFGSGFRHDHYHIVWSRLSMPLARFAEVSVDYLFVDSNSTLVGLNYSQNILTFRLGFWY